ncbi:hypothetical protein [Microbacterium flavum]|uniref:Uncharacterized protein n=2 Tax=Microbacterium flavum TaxID=415216 RepID=A0ABS5XS09_9MICO|nr:hypothetical protein [Microbacterium flavum]MBT8797325.1 hypothetical protein [Microbacterium flavum]
MSENLCAGPRGRRVVLELVTALLSEDARRALFELAYQADMDAGAAITRLTFTAPGDAGQTDGAGDEADAAPESATLSQLAQAIRAARELGPLAPDGEALAAALLRGVDSARYWQAPDGMDIVAADPDVRAALTEAAAWLDAHPDAAWWRRDRTASQWAVEFDPSGDGAPFDPAPAAAGRWSTDAAEDESRARRERPADVTAAFSGAWWSHPWGAPHTTGELPEGLTRVPDAPGLPAGIPYVEDGFGWTRAVAVPVRGAGQTYEIRGAAEWAHLCGAYPREVTASRRHDWYRVTGREGRWLLPDWGRVAEDWDAVHLTGWAYLTAATREIVVDAEYSSVIGGWGPDETYWLTGLVREVEGPRVHWRADAPEGPWRRGQ